MLRIEAVRMSVILQFLYLLLRSRHVRVAQLIEQFIDVLRRLSHGLDQRFLCVGLVAKEVSERQAGVNNLHDNTGVVELAAYTATCGCHVQLATDVTVIQILHHRTCRRRLEVQQPAVETFLLSVRLEHGLGVVIQTCQQRLIGDEHGPSVGRLEHVLTELNREFAQFGTQFTIFLFVRRTEVRAIIGKAVVDVLQQFLLCLVQFEFRALVIDRLDALEKFLIQTDSSAVLRHLRTQFERDLL